MMKNRDRVIAAMVVFAVAGVPVAQAKASSSTAYAGARIEGKTEVEKAIGRCVLAVGLGALAGGVLADKRRRGEGVVLGAAAGGLVCAAMLSIASNKDKEYLRSLQVQVLNSGQSRTDQWQTADNKAASATVTASNVVQVTAPKTAEVLNCRRLNTDLQIDDQQNASSDIVCLKGDSWVTLDKLKPYGVRPQDVVV